MHSLMSRLERAGIRLPHPHAGENRAACPRCDKGMHDDALAVLIDADHATWICHRCHWASATYANGRASQTRQNGHRAIAAPKDRSSVMERAREIWRTAVPLAGTAGAAYLIRRGCALPPAAGDVRFAPHLHCSKVERFLPAIVCKVTTVEGNRFAGIHRIFLDPDGSSRAHAKMRLGGDDDAVCIRLWPEEDVTLGLAIAEGIETALAAAQLYRPIWSTIDAGQMARFPVLRGIESLLIFADHDEAGMKAANDCRDRWRKAGIEVRAEIPKRLGCDINDVLLGGQNAGVH
jgi:phage/plasmid primase-like uncharacterized protein